MPAALRVAVLVRPYDRAEEAAARIDAQDNVVLENQNLRMVFVKNLHGYTAAVVSVYDGKRWRQVAVSQPIGNIAYRTTDGTLQDLDPQPDFNVWEKVKSEHGNCMGHRCPHYSICFHQKARRRAQHAQLLIVNHALFFADLALRSRGLGSCWTTLHLAWEQEVADLLGIPAEVMQVALLPVAYTLVDDAQRQLFRGLRALRRLVTGRRAADPKGESPTPPRP